MGQAKQRGNFEERRQQSIALRKEQERIAAEEAAELRRIEDERWNSLTPEQQGAECTAKRRRNPALAFLGVAMIAAASMPSRRSVFFK